MNHCLDLRDEKEHYVKVTHFTSPYFATILMHITVWTN